MRIAVVGSGVSGLTAAWLLSKRHEVHVFEAQQRIGGHTNTVLCADPDSPTSDGAQRHFAVDTGFIVFNERTYPLFSRLLNHLGVGSQPSSMSLSVRCDATGFEYCGTSLNTLFSQRSNLFKPGFYAMLIEVLRFNRLALGSENSPATLEEFLRSNRFSDRLIAHYVVPMTAAIWSARRDAVLAMPMGFFVRFFRNHGMLSINDRPEWRTIIGGAGSYVAALTAPFRDRIRLSHPVHRIERRNNQVLIGTDQGTEQFDHVVIASHSNEALAMIADPTHSERDILGAISYQPNEAVLHTDESLLPSRTRAWAAWNAHVELGQDTGSGCLPAGVTYNLTILQRLPTRTQFLVTLNRTESIDRRKILRRIVYQHPVFTAAGVAAQARHSEISGRGRTHYCGAYWGNGFHEDGVRSAVEVGRVFGEEL